MSDIQGAEGNQGNSGFASEWSRLAREEQSGPEQSPREADRLGDDTQAEPGNSGQAEQPPATEAAPEPARQENRDDLWASAPPALREAFEAERKAREKAENTIRSNNGRLSKAEREAAELRARIAAPPAPQAPSQTAEQDNERLGKLKAVAEEYEDVNGPVVEEVLSLRETVQRLAAAQASVDEQRQAQAALAEAEYIAEQEHALSEAHSDWRDVVLEPAFVSWVAEAPQLIKDGIARNAKGIVSAKESAMILDIYKASRGTAPTNALADRRQRQLEGSRAVPARVPGATPAGTPDDFEAEWKRLQEKERRERQRAI